MKKDICETCKHYYMVDSGFGECRRFPPGWEKQRIKKWKKLEWRLIYLEVAWCTDACGEYQTRDSLKDIEV